MALPVEDSGALPSKNCNNFHPPAYLEARDWDIRRQLYRGQCVVLTQGTEVKRWDSTPANLLLHVPVPFPVKSALLCVKKK